MRRDWKKYLNKQKYSECQLITAINAYYFLTGKTLEQDSNEYEDLVTLCGARYGSATSIEKIYKRLNLKIIWSGSSLFDLEYKGGQKIPLPIEFNCWHKKTGFHSTLIVDHVIKCGVYRITNFKYATSIEGWMFTEDLYQFETRRIRGNKMFKLFGI